MRTNQHFSTRPEAEFLIGSITSALTAGLTPASWSPWSLAGEDEQKKTPPTFAHDCNSGPQLCASDMGKCHAKASAQPHCEKSGSVEPMTCPSSDCATQPSECLAPVSTNCESPSTESC